MKHVDICVLLIALLWILNCWWTKCFGSIIVNLTLLIFIFSSLWFEITYLYWILCIVMRHVVIVPNKMTLDGYIDIDAIMGIIDVEVFANKFYWYRGHFLWVLLMLRSLFKSVIELKVIISDFMVCGCFSLVSVDIVHDNLDICIQYTWLLLLMIVILVIVICNTWDWSTW